MVYEVLMNPQSPLLFSGSSHPSFAQEVADHLEVRLGQLQLDCFPDGEISLEILESVRNRDVYVIQSIALDPNFYLMEFLIIIDALKRASAKTITAILPYFGYARQDRQDKPRVPITAKLVANLLVQSGVTHLITMDLHALQIEGFFDIPIDHLLSRSILVQACTELNLTDPVVVAPDIGSIKMANAFAKQLGIETAIIDKQRVHSNRVDVNMFIGDIRGRDVIFIDDMCSTAATLVSAAVACRKLGAQRLFAAVAHGLCVGHAIERLEQSPLEALIMTNTVPSTDRLNSCTKIKIVSVTSLFAQAILRNQTQINDTL